MNRQRPHIVSLGLLLFGCLLGSVRGQGVPTPQVHLGYRAGDDFHLAEWATVRDYFEKVDRASDRVVVRTLGETTEGRPYLLAVVSSPETINRLDRYRELQRRLSQPRTLGPADGPPEPKNESELPAWIAESKTVIVITCSIHSTETASTLMAMELLHELATSDDAATREILDRTILLLVPSANPDGVDKVARWYERSKGHPWEGSGMPELYHVYAGHDTNRDWFMLNLKETQLLTRVLYHEWFPTIHYDVHQMGSRGARIFVPPFYDPINPNLDPRISQGIVAIGAHMASDLAAAGKRGVLTNAMYDNWWNGGNRTTPQRHNIVAVLTEVASVKLASPIFLEQTDLRGGSRGFANHRPAVNFADPWPGGWWRLRDIIDYELICARSILTLAARYRTQFQSNLAAMSRAAVKKGSDEPPHAWLVPAEQPDPGRAAEMVRILNATGIVVERATSPFQVAGRTQPAGTWILPAAQPYRAHLKDMMERQAYPRRLNPDGTAEPPYDVAGWTLPLLMGVRTAAAAEPFSATTERLERVEPSRGWIEGKLQDARFFTIANRANDDFLVLNALFEAGVDVELLDGGDVDSEWFGALRFPADARARQVLDRILPSASTRVKALAEATGSSARRLAAPGPVALYQPWVPSMDEGWTRLVLEKYGFKYTTVHNADICAGNLIERFRVLIIPSISPRALRDGFGENQTEPAYVGGLGAEGVESLREFLRGGGTLICLADSTDYAIDELNLPVKNVLRGLKTSEFYAPGSILRAVRAGGAPAASTIGVPRELSLHFDNSQAFQVDEAALGKGQAAVILNYAKKQPLESGWLLGPEKIEGKAALVELDVLGGRVILFGFSPQHRGQTHGTFRLLFNCLFDYAQGGLSRATSN
jgi:hypothetical protein